VPSKKTRVSDLPTDKAIRKLFPPAVVKQAKETARQGDKRRAVKRK
jgi:hypothetical protein